MGELDFLKGTDVVDIARRLVGVELISELGGVTTAGFITETEAYRAPEDRASHAYGNRRTGRTEVFFGPAGVSYVYLCYGIHELFNVITGPVGTPHAVLIRAVYPSRGVEHMMERRNMKTLKPQLSCGPGVVAKALGISRDQNGLNLLHNDSPLRLAVTETLPAASEVLATPRIGIDGAGAEWAAKPWRFIRKGTGFISRPNAFK